MVETKRSIVKVLKQKITEVDEEIPQETVIPTKKNKKTIDKVAEKGVQASTSSAITKKVEAPLKRGRGRPRKKLIRYYFIWNYFKFFIILLKY